MLKKIFSPSSTSSTANSAQISHTTSRSQTKKERDLDLTELFHIPEICGYITNSQQALIDLPLLRKKDTSFEIISSKDLKREFKRASFSLTTKGARFAKPLSEMYKYISYNAYETRLTDYDNQGLDRKVTLLDVKTKQVDADTPLFIYCHGSHRDLGSLAHYFADFVSQMKAEIVAFEIPNFGPQERKTPSKITQSLIMSYAELAYSYAQGILQGSSRKIFIYGQGSGAIAAVELAKRHRGQVSGLILEDAIIEFKKKKGFIFKRLVRQDRYLEAVGELEQVSVLLFHGTQGQQAPFSYAQDIMDKLFNGNKGKKAPRSVVQERKVISEVAGKSVMRNTSILENIIGKKKQRYRFEGYFVECDNGQVMSLKRSTYYSVLRDFVIDVNSFEAENYSIMMNPFQVAAHQKPRFLNNSQNSSPLNSSRSLQKYYTKQDSGLNNLSLTRLQSCEEADQSNEDDPFDHAVSPTNVALSRISEQIEHSSSPSQRRKKLLNQVKQMLWEGKEEVTHDSQNVSTSPGTKEGTPKAYESHRSLLRIKRAHPPTIKREWQLKDEEGIRSFLSSKMSDQGAQNVNEQGEEYGKEFLQPVSLINPRKYSVYNEKE